MSSKLVLVTGGSGFIGVHCILQLLQAGYRVRTTVRSLEREPDVRSMLRVGGVEPDDALSFAVANLTSDEGWPQAAGRLRLRPACCFAVSAEGSKERE
jgi:nucleoside-diphosphate-sugar epimerase